MKFSHVFWALIMPLQLLTGMEPLNPIFPDTPINQNTEPDHRYLPGNGFGDFTNTRSYTSAEFVPGLPNVTVISSYYFGINLAQSIVRKIPDDQRDKILTKLGIQGPADELYFVIQNISQEEIAEGKQTTQDLAIKPQAQVFSIQDIQQIYDKAKKLEPDTSITKNVDIHLKSLAGSPLKDKSYPSQGVVIHIDKATTEEAYPFFSGNTHHILKSDGNALERKDLLLQPYSMLLDIHCDGKRYIQIHHIMDKDVYLNEFLTPASDLKYPTWLSLYNHIIGSTNPKLQELKTLVTTITTP
jgi:hypothetical protein